MDEPFGRIPEVEAYAGGELVTILTSISRQIKSSVILVDCWIKVDSNLRWYTSLALLLLLIPKLKVLKYMMEQMVDFKDVTFLSFNNLVLFCVNSHLLRRLLLVKRNYQFQTLLTTWEEQTTRYLHVFASGSKRKIRSSNASSWCCTWRVWGIDSKASVWGCTQTAFSQGEEMTHLQFQPWCAFCVQAKSRGHYKHRSTGENRANRSFPTVQIDFFTLSSGMSALIMVDEWTKYVAVEPLRSNLSSLNHFDMIEVAYDNEPVLSAGVRWCQDGANYQGQSGTSHGATTRQNVRQRKDEPCGAVYTDSALTREMLHSIPGVKDADEAARNPRSPWMANCSCWLVAQ